jgi:type II secretory pathway pseudopilin PulG
MFIPPKWSTMCLCCDGMVEWRRLRPVANQARSHANATRPQVRTGRGLEWWIDPIGPDGDRVKNERLGQAIPATNVLSACYPWRSADSDLPHDQDGRRIAIGVSKNGTKQSNMKTISQTNQRKRGREGAVTLLEVMIGVSLMGVMFVSLYVGFTSGFAIIQLARENLRATQVLQEKTETLRLLTWEQLSQMKTEMAEPFYSAGSSLESGLTYDLRVIIPTESPVAETPYASDIRQVTVEARWTSGGVERRRSMTTYVARQGLHRYRY